MENKSAHESFMRRCFELAKLGESYTAPNPMVGAVLVHEGKIIGEGYHQHYGEAHAEVNCLNSVREVDKKLISSSTLFVSLEPCNHHGKTPPCTKLILLHKIPKVVISVQDNFHLVSGKGIQRLRENNVEVITGILEEEGKELLKHFLYFNQYKKPYITLKWAQSKDGFIGIKNEEISISNELTKHYTHKLRAQHQSILVGKNTVLTDNPALTVRHWNGRNPVRIILSEENSIPKNYHIFNNEAETIFLPNLSINEILQTLYAKNIISVLIEGGAQTLQQFIDADAWNEAHVISGNVSLRQNSNLISTPVIKGVLQDTFFIGDNTIQLLSSERK